MRSLEIQRTPNGAIPSLTSHVSPQAPQQARRLQRQSSRGCVFCLQYAIWVDSGKRSKQVSQRTKRCSCNILPPEKHTSWIVPLKLCSAPHFSSSGMGTRVKTHGACGQRRPVLVQHPTLPLCHLELITLGFEPQFSHG